MEMTMTKNSNFIKRLIFSLVVVALMAVPGAALAQSLPDPVKEDMLETGKKVYFKRCVWCHGVEGGGDGPSADRLYTRPRNFIQGTFKIRVTDSGELPMDINLINTVKNGLQGSAMPAWGEFLSENEILSVVQFVKSLVQDREWNDEDEEVNNVITGIAQIMVKDRLAMPLGQQQKDHTIWGFLKKTLMLAERCLRKISAKSVMVVRDVVMVTLL